MTYRVKPTQQAKPDVGYPAGEAPSAGGLADGYYPQADPAAQGHEHLHGLATHTRQVAGWGVLAGPWMPLARRPFPSRGLSRNQFKGGYGVRLN